MKQAKYTVFAALLVLAFSSQVQVVSSQVLAADSLVSESDSISKKKTLVYTFAIQDNIHSAPEHLRG